MISLFVPLAQCIGTVLQFVAALLSQDRRAMVLDRLAKVLSLAKKLKAAGLTARDLRLLERRLTEKTNQTMSFEREGPRCANGCYSCCRMVAQRAAYPAPVMPPVEHSAGGPAQKVDT